MLNPICDELDRFLACALLDEGGVIRNVPLACILALLESWKIMAV
jgi:hypothetical protein